MLPFLVKLKRFLERRTQTDIGYVSRSGFWLLLNQSISIATSLITTTAFGRLFSQENYGTYRYLLATYGLLTIFTLPGVRTAVTRLTSQGNEGALPYGVKMQMKGALVGSLVAAGIAAWYWHAGNHLLMMGMLVISVLLPITDTTDIGSFLQGKKRFRALFGYNLLITLFTTCAILLGLWLKLSSLGLFILFLGSTAIARLSVYWRYAPRAINDNAFIKKEIRDYGTHLSLLSVLSISASSLDKILLFQLLDAASVAQYAFAISIPNQMRGVIRHIGTLSLPKFSQRSQPEVHIGLRRRLPFLAIGVGVAIFSYILLAPLIFRLLFPAYLGVLVYSQIFSLSILDSITYPITAALSAHKKTRSLFILTVAIYGSNIIFMLIAIPLYGLRGAVISGLASRIITVIFGLWTLRRKNWLE